jgi:UDP-N-acetylglucosamine--N-acetylmuramyl-(pentapeptide) pyrophosphoryl-undecaprenol N-acetylglucosamine transferase
LANRICASKAVALLLSFPDTQGDYPREKSRVVGNPVRSAFLSPPSTTEARERFSLNATLPTVLVMGGSQGAHSINQAMANMAHLFKENEIQFIWATGQSEALWARNAVNEAPITVQVHAFIEDMATACAASDMVVSRAGASSTAELAAMGKPSILVPYPHAADNHQEHNARAFEQTGAAVVLLDKECTGDALSSIIKELLSQPLRLQNMSQAAFSLAKLSAAEEIAETIVRRVWGTEEVTAT